MRDAYVIAISIFIAALIISFSLPDNRYQAFSPADWRGDSVIVDVKNKTSCVLPISERSRKTFIDNNFKICNKK